MRARLLLSGAGLAVFGILAVSLLPMNREFLRLRPSGDWADREPFGGKRVIEQRLQLQETHAIRAVELLLRPPAPQTGKLTVQVRQGTERRRVHLPFATVREDTVLHIPFPPISVAAGEDLTFTIEARDIPDGSAALATATGVAETFQGELRVGRELRDRHLALALFTQTSRGQFLKDQIAGAASHALRLPVGTVRGVALGTLIGLLSYGLLRQSLPTRNFRFFLVFAGILALTLHEPFRTSYPATNDEGSLLMDIQNIRAGSWPFRDAGGSKGPLGLAMLAPVVFAGGNSLLAARGVVAFLAALEAVLLGLLGRRLWGTRAGVLAALLYAATPAAIAQTTQVFLQAFALPFATLALIVLLGNGKRGKRNFLAGALFGLAFLARQTTLAFAPIGLLLLLSETTDISWPARLRHGAVLLAGLFLPIIITSTLVFPFLGPWKTLDFLGWQGVLVGQQRATLGTAAPGVRVLFAEPPTAQIRTLVQKAQPLLVGALPLLVLTAAFLVQRLGTLLRFPKFVTAPSPKAPAFRPGMKGGPEVLSAEPTLLAGSPLGHPLGFAARIRRGPHLMPRPYEGLGGFTAAALLAMTFTAVPLLARQNLTPGNPEARPFVLWSSAALLPLAALSVLRRPDKETRPGRDLLLIGGTWLLLVVGYANYGRFRSHYHAEFLPLYVLAAAAFLAESLEHTARSPLRRLRTLSSIARRVPSAALFLFTAIPLLLSFSIVLRNHHAGNIPLNVAEDVAADLRERTSPGEEIFTAQVLFPFLADRFVPFGISHPGWYREEALGILPTALRARYYPERDKLRTYVEEHPVRVIVVERRTREVYLEFDPALRELIQKRYALARTFRNPLIDTIEIWQRRTD